MTINLNELKAKYNSLPRPVIASFWFLICAFLQKGIQLISTPIITRLLTSEEFGQYSVFDSWLKILTIFITLQLYSGVYAQGLIKYSHDRNIFSSSLQGLTLSLTVAWSIIYLLFRHFWNELFSLTTVQMLSMLAMMWATSVFCFWSSEQRVQYKFKSLVTITLIVSFGKPIVGIIFIILSKNKVTAYILSLAIVEFIGYIVFFFIQINRGKKFYSKKYWLYAIGFNLPLIGHYLAQNVLNCSDRIMIKYMVDDSKAGIYSLAYSISQIMILFNTAMMQTISPWIYQKIKEKKVKDISQIAYLALMIIAVVNIALIAVAPEAVVFFAPKQYHEAIWVIPPVAMSVIFQFSYDLFAKFEFYYEKTKWIMIASVSCALLNMLLNYFFIDKFGYVSAAYTTLICYILYSFFNYLFMRKVCIIHLDSIKVYEPQKLLHIYILFLIISFLVMSTYNCYLIRYSIIITSLIIVLIKHKNIKEYLFKIVRIRIN